MPFPDAFADVVLCKLRPSTSPATANTSSPWSQEIVAHPPPRRPLVLQARAPCIGMDFERIRGNIYRLGDGDEWFLVDESKLMQVTKQLNAELVDPLKTTIVQDRRCMTTWVVRKPPA